MMKKYLAFILLVLGLALLGAALWLGLHSSLPQRTPTEPVASGDAPATLAGFALTEKTTGAEAIAQIQNLHLSDLALTDGLVAVYGTQQAVVWIAAAESDSVAAALIASMETSIANANSEFSPASVLNFGGREVYEVEGLGQLHFYFQSGNKVIWLSADQGVAEMALTELMKFYP